MTGHPSYLLSYAAGVRICSMDPEVSFDGEGQKSLDALELYRGAC